MKRIVLAGLAVIGVVIVAVAVVGLMHPARLRRFLPTSSLAPNNSVTMVASQGQQSTAVQTAAKGSSTMASLAAAPFSQLQAPALDAVDLVSDTVGYVGGQGLILKSADGGQTWTKLYASPDNVVSVDAVDAVNVWAATGDYLLRSTDGHSFRRVDPAINAGQNGKGISAIDFVNSDQGFILANGVIWRLTNGANVQPATPPGRVDSLSFVDQNTGFATVANVVFKTSDGGESWARIFTAPVAGPDAWQAVIGAGSATNAWFLAYGGDAGLGHDAYVVFHTTDGNRFTPAMDEGYMSPTAYPTIHLDYSQNIGDRPGPFTVRGDQDAFFMGWSAVQFLLTRTVDNGKSFTSTDIAAHLDTLPDSGSPIGISFADATHGWLVGSQNRQGIILYTTDGDTFKPVP